MIIRVKCMGMLKEHTPEKGTLEIAEPATIQDVLKAIGVDATTIHAVTVNGSLERDQLRELAANDELLVLPPVGGG